MTDSIHSKAQDPQPGEARAKMVADYERKIEKPVLEWGSLDLAGFVSFCERARLSEASSLDASEKEKNQP